MEVVWVVGNVGSHVDLERDEVPSAVVRLCEMLEAMEHPRSDIHGSEDGLAYFVPFNIDCDLLYSRHAHHGVFTSLRCCGVLFDSRPEALGCTLVQLPPVACRRILGQKQLNGLSTVHVKQMALQRIKRGLVPQIVQYRIGG